MVKPLSAKTTRSLATLALILALFVVMLGAYTRLTDAGLGCPDWPGCYGKLILPAQSQGLEQAQHAYPQIPIEARKAWTEMAHRYAAGTLALLILILAINAVWQYCQKAAISLTFPFALIGLVIFQAALGMWTVTLKLLPVVVMGHLLGGIIIFSCLSALRLQYSSISTVPLEPWHRWIGLALAIVFIQIALGGWVSSNYAGIACIGFPQCNGQWLPSLHFAKGFNLLSAVGQNYQGGVLDNDVRVTIQWVHRLGALITALYLIILNGLLIVKIRNPILQRFALTIILLVITQFILGILNVVYLLPLWVAVAHNGVAALLMASVFMLFYLTKPRKVHARG